MMIARKVVLLASVSLIAACANKQAAPVVYGSQPQWQGRVYNSPDELADERARDEALQNARRASRQTRMAEQFPITPASAMRPARSSDSGFEVTEPAPLVRTSAVKTPPTSRQRFDYDSKPIYLSNAEREKAMEGNGSEAVASQRQPSMERITVRAGDTVYAIARRTGQTPDAVIAANRLKAPFTLSVGQELLVPGSSASVSLSQPAKTLRPSNASTKSSGNRMHMVRDGDTLFGIARSNGVTVNDIARANQLREPFTLSVGDKLIIPGEGAAASAPTTRREASRTTDGVATIAKQASFAAPARPEDSFDWPVKGAIIAKYSAGSVGKRNDGINIAAPVGTPVRAAADGEVVYRGDELDGYGNLLLIKHDDGFVTAYAHNDVMLVRKGQRVRQGQVVAKVGQSGSASEPQLHFEIRQNLKAVDPLAFLGG